MSWLVDLLEMAGGVQTFVSSAKWAERNFFPRQKTILEEIGSRIQPVYGPKSGESHDVSEDVEETPIGQYSISGFGGYVLRMDGPS
jgi:hypothetical protein